ncbi:MAG: hypothetical protein Q9227_005356 [Pyrenula ochraceoflavens]
MSGPTGAPSPAPRSASLGPGAAGMQLPPHPQVNGTSSGNVTTAGGTTSGGASTMSQQNLNQIVIDYLAKKGYTRTESMLRVESSNQEVSESLASPRTLAPVLPQKYVEAFDALKNWIDDALDIYKPELQRILWPVFVYSFLELVSRGQDGLSQRFMDSCKALFTQEHSEDLRVLQPLTTPVHLEENQLAKRYRENKYRLALSQPAYVALMQFMETLGDRNRPLMDIIGGKCNIKQSERASENRFSLAAILARGRETQDFPDEDEGIPGHPAGAVYDDEGSVHARVIRKMKLGKRPMDPDLEGDVRADLHDLDAKDPRPPGAPSLVDTHEEINIKQEPEDDVPTASEPPLPPSTARSVAMEVQKICENRDRFKIESRTGGIGPGLSVCMFTFHNTFDSINCIDFSGDEKLVAAGTSESYIRVWSLDGKAIPSTDGSSASSHRLIGHSGPVYAVAFSPIRQTPPGSDISQSNGWLLSSSADSTIRLWSLDLWQNIVVYKAHIGPVWDLAWGPFGHYFVSGGHDKTARLWSTDHIRPLRIFSGHEDGVDVVAFHPNSAYLFTASTDRTVRMWRLTDGQPVRMFTGHSTSITAMACSPSGKFLASADDAGNIILWNLATAHLHKRMRGHGKGGVWSLSFSVESTVLVSGGADNTVRVWDVFGPAKDSSAPGKPGEGPKVDGTGPVGGASAVAAKPAGMAGVTAGGGKRRGKEAVVTGDQISAFPTKKTPVYKVQCTGMNLVIAGADEQRPDKKKGVQAQDRVAQDDGLLPLIELEPGLRDSFARLKEAISKL